MAGIPKSAVSLTIPPDSLRKLPSGSSYHSRNGQAGLTVKSDAAGNIIAEASCDSLQRLVLCYEEELTVSVMRHMRTHSQLKRNLDVALVPLK